MKRFLLLAIFLCSTSFAQTCAEQLPNAFVYKGIGNAVGLIYFNTADTNTNQAEFRFSGGVCLEGKEGWQLITEAIEITALPEGRAENVSVSFQDWQLQADFLQANPSGLRMQGITFFGEGIQGLAKEASYDFLSKELVLTEALTTGENLRISGQRATLAGEKVFFEGIKATTCNCKGDPFYTLVADQATLELSSQKLLIQQGSLNLFGLPIALKNLELSPESLENFRFPVVIEYIPESPDTTGTGLGIRMPALSIDKTFSLELGAVGLDTNYPLKGVLVAHYQDARSSFDVGYTGQGFQGDATIKQAVAPNTRVVFAVRNRDWQSQDFLHEGYLALEHAGNWQNIKYEAKALAAISSQTLQETFHDGRFGSEVTLQYPVRIPAFGQLDLNLQGNLTYYPMRNQTQWGLRFYPRWQYQRGGFQVQLNYLEQWTNSASPFSSKLDKLEPKRQVSLSTSVKGSLNQHLYGDFSLRVSYDFLAVEADLLQGFTELGFKSRLDYTWQELSFSPFIHAEFAPSFNSDLNTTSHLEFGLRVQAPRWETGLSATLNDSFSLNKLEFRTAFPMDFENFSLKPFIALDLMPTLNALEFPRVSGHGLELTWRSCCGTISLGYRQEENNFKTLIGFSL